MGHLNFKSMGEGHPVIILHGLLGMLDNWKTVGRKLSDSYQIYLVDQRNHGKSFHSDEFTYTLLAEDLKQWMDEEEISSAHLIGHSMGGKTVMQFAQMYPDSVDKTVVVDIAPRGAIGGHQHIFESLLAVDLSGVEKRSEVQEFLQGRGLELGIVYFLMKNLKRDVDSGGFAWKANIESLWNNYQNILAPTQGDQPSDEPILFIAGGKSNYITDDDLVQISELFPQHLYEKIEGAGHWVHAEKPAELMEIVRNFLG